MWLTKNVFTNSIKSDLVAKVILFRVGQEEETVILAKTKGYGSDHVYKLSGPLLWVHEAWEQGLGCIGLPVLSCPPTGALRMSSSPGQV